jgi:hypothetical protein
MLAEAIGTVVVDLSACGTRILNPRHKLLGFHMSGVSILLGKPNKETVMVKAEKGGLLHSLGHTWEVGRGSVSTQPVFSHPPGTDMALVLNSKELGLRTKGLQKQSQSQVLLGWSLDQFLFQRNCYCCHHLRGAIRFS